MITISNDTPRINKMIPIRQGMVVKQSSELMSMMPELEKSLQAIPVLYAQDGKGNNAIIYAHYFTGASDWYITEYDEEHDEAFGYVILNGDIEMSELGYIPISELRSIGSVELDFHWTPITIGEMKKQKGI